MFCLGKTFFDISSLPIVNYNEEFISNTKMICIDKYMDKWNQNAAFTVFW